MLKELFRDIIDIISLRTYYWNKNVYPVINHHDQLISKFPAPYYYHLFAAHWTSVNLIQMLFGYKSEMLKRDFFKKSIKDVSDKFLFDIYSFLMSGILGEIAAIRKSDADFYEQFVVKFFPSGMARSNFMDFSSISSNEYPFFFNKLMCKLWHLIGCDSDPAVTHGFATGAQFWFNSYLDLARQNK